MCKRESGPSSNRKPSICLNKQNEKNASENRKSIEYRSNGSEKSEKRKRNSNVSVVCEHEKNVSKSVSGACSGMSRSSASENNAWHASKNAWLAELLLQDLHHRLCPGYWLMISPSSPSPTPLQPSPTPTKSNF